MDKSLGFGKRTWVSQPKPTPTKLKVRQPPVTPLEEMAQMFRLITG